MSAAYFGNVKLYSSFNLNLTLGNVFSNDFKAQNGDDRQPALIRTKNELMEIVGIIQLTPWNYFLSFPKSIVQILCLLPIAVWSWKIFLNAKYFFWKVSVA